MGTWWHARRRRLEVLASEASSRAVCAHGWARPHPTAVADLTSDVRSLATEAGRLPGTPGHDAARRFLRGRFAGLALVPYRGLVGYEHTFQTSAWRLTATNLVGVIPGADPTAAPIVLGAHYDSVLPAPCADDNAAAVAVMLAVAERLVVSPLSRDVVIVSFDTEEPPFFLTPDMGSTRFVQDVLRRPVHLAVIMDLVGHPVSAPGLELDPDLIFVTGAESHPELPGTLAEMGLPVVATRNDRVGDYSDHHAFRVAGIPYLFFSCAEWEHYHQPSDRPERLDFAKMQHLVADLDVLLRRADRAEMGKQVDHDCTDFELDTMRRHLGEPLLAEAARMMGAQQVRTRADLDVLVPLLRTYVSGW